MVGDLVGVLVKQPEATFFRVGDMLCTGIHIDERKNSLNHDRVSRIYVWTCDQNGRQMIVECAFTDEVVGMVFRPYLDWRWLIPNAAAELGVVFPGEQPVPPTEQPIDDGLVKW